MKRIKIICEGETEKEFCSKILSPEFSVREIYIFPQLIKKSMGGVVHWSELKKQIIMNLKNDPACYVTTLIDYYGINKKLDFPGWDEANQIYDILSRVDFMESCMKEEIEDSIRHRFIPYLQLHEFEGLLFNDIDVFYHQIPDNELVGISELKQTFQDFDNPEMINNNPETSPSHRLSRIIRRYNKVVYGNILAEAIGLKRIKSKSPRFKDWLNKIESI